MICLFYVEESISGYNVQVHEWFDLGFVWRNKSLTNNYVFVILPNYGEYGMPKTITGSTTFVIYPPLWLTNCTWHTISYKIGGPLGITTIESMLIS